MAAENVSPGKEHLRKKIGTNRKKTEQIGTNWNKWGPYRKEAAQIRTNREKREIGANQNKHPSAEPKIGGSDICSSPRIHVTLAQNPDLFSLLFWISLLSFS